MSQDSKNLEFPIASEFLLVYYYVPTYISEIRMWSERTIRLEGGKKKEKETKSFHLSTDTHSTRYILK